jgi:hypothetical protein
VVTLSWRIDTSGGEVQHRFAYRFPNPFDATSTAALETRLLGHLMLDRLPDDALPEVLEFLASAWAFYQPSPPQIEAAAERRLVKGKMTKRYERPAYSLSDEE